MFKSVKGKILLPFFILSTSLVAQVTTVSPYSRLGLGDLLPQGYARQMGFGQASLALPQPINIDFSNPASYQALELVTLEAGLEYTQLRLQQDNPPINSENSRSGFRYLAVGLPVTNWYGTSLGLRPYSFKGYEIVTNRTLEADPTVEIEDAFLGEGGLNQVYWGNAFRIGNSLSLGINASYLWGNLRELRRVNFLDGSFFDTQTEDEITVGGLLLEYGAQYQHNYGNDFYLSGAVAMSLATDIDATRLNYQYTLNGNEITDTLKGGFTENGTLTIPGELKMGLSWGRNHSAILNPAWAINLDYELYQGSSFTDFQGDNPLNDGYRLQVGGFMVPRFSIKKWERSNLYFNNMEYRLGAFYEETPLVVDGQTIENYGITFGFGLPIKQRSQAPGEVRITTLNIGFNYGQRGTLQNDLIREEYWAFYLGLTFSNKWFIDYKYR